MTSAVLRHDGDEAPVRGTSADCSAMSSATPMSCSECGREIYDFAKATRNPYAKRLKRSVTIRLDDSTVEYFKALAEATQLPYHSLISL